MAVDLEVRTTTPPVLSAVITGKLEREDYEELVPAVETLINEHGKIRVLVELVDFHGWSVGALWEDIKFDAKHFNDIERVAIVGDKAWEKGMSVFCKPFTTAEVRFFEVGEADEAGKWVRGAKARDTADAARQS